MPLVTLSGHGVYGKLRQPETKNWNEPLFHGCDETLCGARLARWAVSYLGWSQASSLLVLLVPIGDRAVSLLDMGDGPAGACFPPPVLTQAMTKFGAELLGKQDRQTASTLFAWLLLAELALGSLAAALRCSIGPVGALDRLIRQRLVAFALSPSRLCPALSRMLLLAAAKGTQDFRFLSQASLAGNLFYCRLRHHGGHAWIWHPSPSPDAPPCEAHHHNSSYRLAIANLLHCCAVRSASRSAMGASAGVRPYRPTSSSPLSLLSRCNPDSCHRHSSLRAIRTVTF